MQVYVAYKLDGMVFWHANVSPLTCKCKCYLNDLNKGEVA